MAENFVGEIRQFAGNFAPVGWSLCDGSQLPISQYEVLYTLLGTTYGGDGVQTFNVPDLRGRVPIGQGGGYALGQAAGSESITLNVNELPSHTHTPMSASVGTTDAPANAVWATAANNGVPYGAAPGSLAMNQNSISSSGGNQPHENRIPFQAVTYIIALEGIYPSQS